MKRPDLSIIIPVYNTGAFIKECLSSVINGLDVNAEIIIVNDGSTDDSHEIITNVIIGHDNIKYIIQENQGLSEARNTGLKNCSGEYTFFLDSDDYILTEDFNELLQVAKTTSADVIVGNILTCVAPLTRWHNYKALNKIPSSFAIVSSDEYCDLLCTYPNAYAPMVFNFLCRTDFIKQYDLMFMEDIIHEDELWTPSILVNAKTIAVSSAAHYFYRIRSGSIMTTALVNKRISSLEVIIPQLKLLLSKCTVDSARFVFLSQLISRLVNLLDRLTCQMA